ncbi:adaptor protein MecA [Nicoliella sp. Es01]|uniref:Adaptor protein MecA n=2 Tax=Nicoliella lavandulae TaxID=3082954 RepID=A0ABU8SLQ4_9LACO
MKMDRINDNTIRVLINNEDLSEHGITVLDLLGDHKQIEEFFYSVLDEIDTDHQFQGDNEALTFQVLPNKNGLELFISKADPNDPEKTQQTNDTVSDYIRNQLKNESNFSSDEFFKNNPDLFKGKDDNYYDKYDAMNYSDMKDNLNNMDSFGDESYGNMKEAIIKMNSFEDFIALSKRLRIENGASSLFIYKGKYYLGLMFVRNLDGSNDDIINNSIALAYEFGHKTDVTIEVLNEYGKKIMATSALELAKYYFKD